MIGQDIDAGYSMLDPQLSLLNPVSRIQHPVSVANFGDELVK